MKKFYLILIIIFIITSCSKKRCTCVTTITENGITISTKSETRVLEGSEHCELTFINNGKTTECTLDPQCRGQQLQRGRPFGDDRTTTTTTTAGAAPQ